MDVAERKGKAASWLHHLQGEAGLREVISTEQGLPSQLNHMSWGHGKHLDEAVTMVSPHQQDHVLLREGQPSRAPRMSALLNWALAPNYSQGGDGQD